MTPKNRIILMTALILAVCLAGAAETASGVSTDKERVAKELALWFKTPVKGVFDEERAKIKELLQKKMLISYQDSDKLNKVKIGFFLGGRTKLFFRAYKNNDFEANGVAAVFYSKVSDHADLFEVPKDEKAFSAVHSGLPFFAKMTGTEIVAEIEAGRLDGGTIGEGSFVAAAHKGAPLVAVAMLGYDATPGKAFILRKDVKIKSPKDFKNKVFTAKESGEGDPVFLKEFFRKEGVDVNDVTIVTQLPYNKVVEAFRQKKVDGGFFHLNRIKILMGNDLAYIYRKMDWVGPELSHALLVFRKDFFEKNKDKVEKIIRIYMDRIDTEGEFALREEEDYEGALNYPAYNKSPVVKLDYLKRMQKLMLEHGAIGREISLERFIDNGIVEKAAKEKSR